MITKRHSVYQISVNRVKHKFVQSCSFWAIAMVFENIYEIYTIQMDVVDL